ncbi:MAG: SAM-dependent methyltransferase [Archangium sp.]
MSQKTEAGPPMQPEPYRREYPPEFWEGIKQRLTRIDRDRHSKLAAYSWEHIYQGAMGPGGLFLASDMAEGMGLAPGQRVLDLGCGRAATSIFLAREYGVEVVAADLWIDPTENWQTIRAAGLGHRVLPLRVDIRHIPFAEESFDAIFCMDSYFYYGTDDFFLRALVKVLKPGAPICIGGPCFSREVDPEPGSVFAFDDALGYHSPGYWKHKFERSRVVVDVTSQEHPLGAEFWQDYLYYNIEHRNDEQTRKHWFEDIAIIDANTDRLLTHFILRARRPNPNRSTHTDRPSLSQGENPPGRNTRE